MASVAAVMGLLAACLAVPQQFPAPAAGAGPGDTGDDAPAPWPMFRAGQSRAGQSLSDTSDNRGDVLWKCMLGSIIYSSPAIGSDGTVFVGCSDHQVYAVRPGGTIAWTVMTGTDVMSSPAIGRDGTVYIGSDALYAISPRGRVLWSFPTEYPMSSSPAVGPDGRIYFGTMQGTLYCLEPNGRVAGWFNASGQIPSSPAIDGEGNIFFGSYDRCIYSLAPDMSLRWSFRTGDDVGATPAIGPDGTVYAGSRDGILYAIHNGGSLKWSHNLRNPLFSSAALGPGGMIYIGSFGKTLYALNESGVVKWDFPTDGWVDSSPSVGADGTVFFGSGDGRLYAVRPNGSLAWSIQTGGSIITSPAISGNGSVVFGSWDRQLYCAGSFYSRPSPPQNLMANVDESNVVLRWDAPEDDGGRPLSGYRVWRCTQTSASAQIAVVAANSRTFADSDVRSRGAYRYHVTALNDIAESLPGNEANITVCFRPSPPCHLRGTAAVGAIVLNWSSPEDDGGAPVLGYNIYCSEAKGSNCLIEILGAGVRGYLHEGLSSLFQYSYEVTAFNKAGESARSNTAQAVPLAPPQAVEPGLLADTQPPWIIISEPLDGSVLHSARITVSGQASDDRGLALVELSNGGSIWHAASGTTGWKRTVTLSKGPNIIFAKATDGQGNTALVHVTVKYEPAKSASTVNVPLASALLVLAAGLAYGIWALRRSRQGGP